MPMPQSIPPSSIIYATTLFTLYSPITTLFNLIPCAFIILPSANSNSISEPKMCKPYKAYEQGHDHGETNGQTKTSCEPAKMIDNY